MDTDKPKRTRKILTTVSERPVWVIGPLWALVNGYYLLKDGIVVTGESEKYIREAHTFIQTGHLHSGNYWLYFTQIFLLSIFIKLKLGFVFPFLVQLTVNLISCFSFQKLALRLFQNKHIALGAVIILLLNLPYQEFNHMMQTESLYFSLAVIYSSWLLRIKNLSLGTIATIAVWLFVLSVTRPTGLLFTPASIVYLFARFLAQNRSAGKLALFVLSWVLFIYALNLALGSGGRLNLMLPFEKENIICEVPTIDEPANISRAENGNSLFGLAFYVTHNFGQFCRLAWLRTLAFFGLWRSYFSLPHNIFLIVYFFSLYLLGILGWRYFPKTQPPAFYFLICLISFMWMTVIITCDDWHNRFFLSISPLLILLSMGFPAKKLNRQSE